MNKFTSNSIPDILFDIFQNVRLLVSIQFAQAFFEHFISVPIFFSKSMPGWCYIVGHWYVDSVLNASNTALPTTICTGIFILLFCILNFSIFFQPRKIAQFSLLPFWVQFKWWFRLFLFQYAIKILFWILKKNIFCMSKNNVDESCWRKNKVSDQNIWMEIRFGSRSAREREKNVEQISLQ